MAACDLTDKHILITGGSMGLGYAAAETCLRANGNVVVCARNLRDIEEAVERLQEKTGRNSIVGVAADITQSEDVEKALDTVESHFGSVNALIHCAGVLGPIGPATEVDPQEWFETIRINLYGTFLMASRCCRRMQKNGGGRIALFSGGGAATPFPNYTAYASSKAAVVRLTETMAQEMAPYGIEINCVAPGFVITRLHQQTLLAGEKAGKEYLQRTKSEIERGGVPATLGASTAAFLISDEAMGITGKFVAAPYDGWQNWPDHIEELRATDVFTLRRIIPKDRAMNWQ